MRERRGQATVFIILGILIILAGYAIFISVQSSSGPSFEMPAVTRQSAATGEAYNVKSFIQTCVDITAKEAVDAFGMYGGEEKPSLLKPVLITGDTRYLTTRSKEPGSSLRTQRSRKTYYPLT